MKKILILILMALMVMQLASANLLDEHTLGTPDAGSISNTFDTNGYGYTLRGSVHEFTTQPLSSTPEEMYLTVWLLDNNKDLDISIWNYNTSAWTLLGTIPSTATKLSQQFIINSTNHYDTNTSEMKVRMDAANSVWEIDKFIISAAGLVETIKRVEQVDWVETVNSVNQLNKAAPTMDVLGTYYEVGDTAKVIAQLSDAGLPVNDATCFASSYYPDNSIFFRNSYMHYIEDSDGLYTYDVVMPNFVGVYPISVSCDYSTVEVQNNQQNVELITGNLISGSLSDVWEDDEMYLIFSPYVSPSDVATFDANLFYDVALNTTAEKLILEWDGVIESQNGHGSVYWWNVETSEWDKSFNELDHTLISVNFIAPSENVTDYLNATGGVKIKLNATVDHPFITSVVFFDDFEDGDISDWSNDDTTHIQSSLSSYLNGNYNVRFNSGTGSLSYAFDTTDKDNIEASFYYTCYGNEADDFFYFEVYDGSSWTPLMSTSGNHPAQQQTFSLDAAYEDNANFQLRFRQDANNNGDKCHIDDVELSWRVIEDIIFKTDLLSLREIATAGVVNEIRGSGEFNVKDRLASIDAALNNLQVSVGVNTDRNILNYLDTSGLYDVGQTTAITIDLTYITNNQQYSETGALCEYTIYGPATQSGIGTLIGSGNFTEVGAGTYFFTTSQSQIGKYTVESNCESVLGGRTYYGLMQYDVEDLAEEIWSYAGSAQNAEVLRKIKEHTRFEGTTIGGTQYQPEDPGKVFLQLIDEGAYVANASVWLWISYPNGTYFAEQQHLPPSDTNLGLYEFNFEAPDTYGVYPVSIVADLDIVPETYYIDSVNYVIGQDEHSCEAETMEVGGDCDWHELDPVNDEFDLNIEFTIDVAGILPSPSSQMTIDLTGRWENDDNGDYGIIEVYNYTSTSWVEIFTMPDAVVTNSFTIDGFAMNDLISGSDTILLRARSGVVATDNKDSKLRINYLAVGVTAAFPDPISLGGAEIHIIDFSTNETVTNIAGATAEEVWTHFNRSLTQNAYNDIADEIWTVNRTINPAMSEQLSTSVWDFVGRYVHGEILN